MATPVRAVLRPQWPLDWQKSKFATIQPEGPTITPQDRALIEAHAFDAAAGQSWEEDVLSSPYNTNVYLKQFIMQYQILAASTQSPVQQLLGFVKVRATCQRPNAKVLSLLTVSSQSSQHCALFFAELMHQYVNVK